ncbi:hypothetical protein MHM88_11300 [Epibacterium sp. MM17-32]|uniref:hypothetical protein n=1 Tax=Epibacterium sp. MM17-32 TaxID=2917734 RepID=UPI001EF54444|nr:hypothetical protein [Epibacterium sp. MM17-32]MCG7628394.1 hypothetical protein [Epibacterium sp. MM17-32]
MAQRIFPAASLSAVASPVDRYVTPAMENTDGWSQLAESLSRINPKLQGAIKTQHQHNVATEEAEGVNAADSIDPAISLNKNREGWKGIISQVRKRDQQMGTNNAEALVGASPHFQRGLVKAKAKRLGLGLNNHLSMQWERDVGGIKSIDDPEAVRRWTQEQTQAYAESGGVDRIDPIIAAEVFAPRAAQSQEAILGKHMTYRAKARVAAFTDEFSANIGLLAAGAGDGASSAEEWIAKMTMSESSGDSSVINPEGYGGWLQFGQDRLDDYNSAHGTDITVAEFAQDEALQRKVNVWHVQDIDKLISENGYLSQGYSLDGLRAVAHLGGKTGMMEFAETGGANGNTADSNGTSLSAYYRKFAGSAAADMQLQADEAIANGVSPKTVNETLVDSLVAQAKATGNKAILDAVGEISTGNGILGNISWVKEKITETKEEIDDELWETEQREKTREDQQRAERRRDLTATGFREIMEDPFADHRPLIEEAIALGEGELARTMHNLQEQLQGEERQVHTDHLAYTLLRKDIFDGIPKDEASQRIVEGVVNGAWTSSEADALYTDLDQSEEIGGMLRDPQVQNWFGNATSIIRERSEMKDVFGNVIVSGREVANEAEMEMTDNLLVFLEQNPSASKAQVRQYVRKMQREVLRDEAYMNINSREAAQGSDTPTQLDSDPATQQGATATQGVEDPLAHLSEDDIRLSAETAGMTPEEYIRSTGSERQLEGSWWNPF